jgi:hypothetical protein
MSALCHALHQVAARLPLHSFPFDERSIPEDGIYLLFEEGENAHGQRRIVRAGTHTGDRQLRPRLRQHFVQENKDRSIFRKNIGRALLHRVNDPFLKDWNLDLTTAAARSLHAGRIDFGKQRLVEALVSKHLQSYCRFIVIPVASKSQRLLWESRMISTISSCPACKPSINWLGRSSPNVKIQNSGLWQVNELYKKPFTEDEFAAFERAALLNGHDLPS